MYKRQQETILIHSSMICKAIYAYIYFLDILASINPGPHDPINQADKHQKPTNLKTRLFLTYH